MAEFNVVTHKDCEIIDITREINERVPPGWSAASAISSARTPPPESPSTRTPTPM